jgi:hypothetical protein
VAIEAVALVLSQDDDSAHVGIHQIGKREINETILASERHSWLGSILGKGGKPPSLPAGEHN